jgi:chromosomal replication initiator protein
LVKTRSYFIKLRWKTYGNKQPFTEQLPSANRAPMKPQNIDAPFKSGPELKNPFVIPGIKKKIESQLNANYSLITFLKETQTD